MTRYHSPTSAGGQPPWRLGVVSFLNSRPLIAGLEHNPDVRLCYEVPSRLSDGLAAGVYDAALIPVIDLLRRDCDLRIVSDACIACRGETLTVRVFSTVPPEQVRRIHIDSDSHSSMALVQLLWPELYRQPVEFVRADAATDLADRESVLLIGDKVVGVDPRRYRYQVDLGGAWKTWTGLPFVFAVWAAPRGGSSAALHRLLGGARDVGVRRTAQIAVEFGPALGWPVPLAQDYLQRYICYHLTDQHAEGMMRFLDLARSRPEVLDHPNLDYLLCAPDAARVP